MATYPYDVQKDDNGTFLITFPDFPEAVTFAETKEAMETRAQDAIDTAIQGRISDKEPIATPRLTF
ncbi:MAG: type II toxin-antitoxin system HicB family antitoxin [Alphaproteobacteria bacterium]